MAASGRDLARLLVFLAVLGLLGHAQAAPRVWTPPGDARWSAAVRSALIVDPDEPLYLVPTSNAPRRGSAAQHARLPVFATFRAEGCGRRWLMVGPQAWVCEDRVALSARAPLALGATPAPGGDGLPYRYYFAGSAGALAYASLEVAEAAAPDAELEPGFAVAVTRVADREGERYGLTKKGLWVPMRDLVPARSFAFHGVELADGALDVGWVIDEAGATLYAAPGGRRLEGDALTRFEHFTVLERATRGQRRWFRVGERRWVKDEDVRAAHPAAPPAGLRPRERWIDVDLATQILVAYEGARPVFATLVSSGRGAAGSELATPKGEHRIWAKLRTADMDNLEDEEASRYYAIQDVPWVMFFDRGYGLHGTFWHRSFGRVRSHGCVNLAPLDAQWLFHWTSPHVPAGWAAALPTGYDAGTLVRVR